MNAYICTMFGAAATVSLLGCSAPLEPVGGRPLQSVPTSEHRVSMTVNDYRKLVVRIDIGSQGSGGSGVVFTKKDHDGYYIVTNAHVMEDSIIGDQNFSVTLFLEHKECRFDKGPDLYIRGYDFLSDLAVLHLREPQSNGCFPDRVAAFDMDRDPSPTQSGTFVLAIGSPLRYYQTVTSGIVSASKRTFARKYQKRDGFFFDRHIGEYIQTDAAINPGNSGGLLADLDGNVVGINTWKREWHLTNDGVRPVDNIGFAISWPYAHSIVNGLIDDRYFWRGGFSDMLLSNALIEHPIVTDGDRYVVTGSDLGLLVRGDTNAYMPQGSLICSVNGVRIRDLADWFSERARMKKGSKAQLSFLSRPDPTTGIEAQCDASQEKVEYTAEDFLLVGEFFAQFMEAGDLQGATFADWRDEGLCTEVGYIRPCGVRIGGLVLDSGGRGFQNRDVIWGLGFGKEWIEVRDLGALGVALGRFRDHVNGKETEAAGAIRDVQHCFVWEGASAGARQRFTEVTSRGLSSRACVGLKREALTARCKSLASEQVVFDVYRKGREGTAKIKIYARLSGGGTHLEFLPKEEIFQPVDCDGL